MCCAHAHKGSGWLCLVMETSSRRLQLPLLPQPATNVIVPLHGHGTCRESSMPSGLRFKRQTEAKMETVGIDYSKLNELCLHLADDSNHRTLSESDRKERHQKFMSSYRQLLKDVPQNRNTTYLETALHKKHCSHSCISSLNDSSHNVAKHMQAIHGSNHTTSQDMMINTHSRLSAMLNIVRKLPLERHANDVKQLAHHLSHFPSLLPTKATPAVLVGVAARCLLESIPKSGFSLPDKGGVYLILQGCVEMKMKEAETLKMTSSQLCEGDHFGAMEEYFITRPSYPMYVTSSACCLMRITVHDYQRVIQNCQTTEREEQLSLMKLCPALRGLAISIITSLAHTIEWETVSPGHTLVKEGEVLTRVRFIQSGQCKALMLVPQTKPPAQIVISELGRGSCVGEALLRGTDLQPHQVTTITSVRIGWVSSAVIRMHEVRKHIPSNRELSIPIPSKETLRNKYAHELMAQHWQKIKSDILSEVVRNQELQPQPQSQSRRWKR